jgi:hypothetical protein
VVHESHDVNMIQATLDQDLDARHFQDRVMALESGLLDRNQLYGKVSIQVCAWETSRY